jgi:Subtilisin inhibitor-like
VNALLALLAVSTSLHITVWAEGKGAAAQSWTLRCAPVAGTLPRRGSACRRLARISRPFAPVPRDAACSQIYGGPQVALVTGSFRGREIRATFNRKNGCEIERWDRVRFLFPGAISG